MPFGPVRWTQGGLCIVWKYAVSSATVRTCWRGLEVDHPANWEVAVASGPSAPGRLVLADRRFHRLDIKWKPIKYVPDLDLMLGRYKRQDKRKGKDPVKRSALKTAPPQWRGMVCKTPNGSVVNAMKFFRKPRLLVDAAIVWPGHRDMSVENSLLTSLDFVGDQSAARLWQAMGLSVTCPGNLDLTESSLEIGRIQWTFTVSNKDADAKRRRALLRVERIAMPDLLLKGQAVRDWLAESLPKEYHMLRQRTVPQGRHVADEIVSTAKCPMGARLKGLQQMRLDLAWQCPIEGRVYHIEFAERRKDEEISIPKSWEVNCCRPLPDIGLSRNAG